jgi:hypothetical protein
MDKTGLQRQIEWMRKELAKPARDEAELLVRRQYAVTLPLLEESLARHVADEERLLGPFQAGVGFAGGTQGWIVRAEKRGGWPG